MKMKMKLGLRGAESEKMKMKLGLHGFEPGMENRIVWSWVCGFEKGMEKMMGDVGEEDCVVMGLRMEADRNGKSFPMQWRRQPDNNDWLARCAIGVLKEFSSINNVSRRLINRDYSFSSSYLGDKNILWSFESELEIEGFLKNRKRLDRGRILILIPQDCKAPHKSEVQPNSKDKQVVRTRLAVEVGKRLTNGSGNKTKSYLSNQNNHRAGMEKFEKVSDVRILLPNMARAQDREVGGGRTEVDKGKRLWLVLSEPEKSSVKVGRFKGECSSKARAVGPLGVGLGQNSQSEAQLTCSNIFVDLTDYQQGEEECRPNWKTDKVAYSDQEMDYGQENKDPEDIVDGSPKSNNDVPPLFPLNVVGEEVKGVTTPAKTSKHRRGRKKVVRPKSHHMRTRNSRDPEPEAVQDAGVEEEEGVTVRWNLGDEMAKVIEKRVALGINFNAEKDSDEQGEDSINPREQWNLEEKVTRIIETGKALGFDFNSNEDEITVVIAKRELEDENRYITHQG
ncbi:hypothetical protein Q3G72_002762 [Acer saccharum]|nr:hypothetical protein Q3G72_002762 [Acer saccharum]